MTIDLVLRAVATLTCIYSVGVFITVMSVSALQSAMMVPGPACGVQGCMTEMADARHHRLEPRLVPVPARMDTAYLGLRGRQ